VELINRNVAKALTAPDVKQRLETLGLDPIGSTPDEFASKIRKDSDRWSNVVKAAHIKID
jgi:tripartite-type tricarboxylate transporter receptor subunit TctC